MVGCGGLRAPVDLSGRATCQPVNTRTWELGTAIVTEGEEADCMYIIHSGELRAVVAGEGRRTLELNTLGPGEFIGELMLNGE